MGNARRRRIFFCRDCGRFTVRESWNDQPRICYECSIARAEQAARDMSSKSGRAYTEWEKSKGPLGRPRKQHRED